MLSGIQEILVILVILLVILFVPRLKSPQRRQAPKKNHLLHNIKYMKVSWRLAIVFSLLWLLGSAAYFRPWQGATELFLLIGCGPVTVGWCLTWVVAGFRPDSKD